MNSRRKLSRPQSQRRSSQKEYELEVLEGLEEFALAEARRAFGSQDTSCQVAAPGRVSLWTSVKLRSLTRLKTVVAVYLVERFQVPRPRALLGHQNMARVLTAVRRVLEANRETPFESFRLSAAGRGSTVMARIKDEICKEVGLEETDGPADLQITVRRSDDDEHPWHVLIRTTAKPLAARDWRVCDYQGALNATIANMMVNLPGTAGGDRFLNLCCGSGTLMVERLHSGSVRHVIGLDTSAEALQCAEANLRESRTLSHSSLLAGDARSVPLPDVSIDAVVADLPFGMLVGDKTDLQDLYARALEESGRVVRPGGNLVMVTTRRRALESAIESARPRLQLKRRIQVKVPFRSGYIRPVVYWLTK